MARINYLKGQLKPGCVYRRTELAHWSKSVDRHLDELLSGGILQKLSQGIYYMPKETAFGKTPPDEKALVQSFLKDDRFLLTSNNDYNSLGLGTTQLYNEQTVYNHKRHGKFKLGNRTFNFKIKPHFPRKLTKGFLVVDLVNNLKELAGEQAVVLQNLTMKVAEMDKKKLKQSVAEYGNVKTKKIFAPLIQS
jgi:hypothetical protein